MHPRRMGWFSSDNHQFGRRLVRRNCLATIQGEECTHCEQIGLFHKLLDASFEDGMCNSLASRQDEVDMGRQRFCVGAKAVFSSHSKASVQKVRSRLVHATENRVDVTLFSRSKCCVESPFKKAEVCDRLFP